MYRCACVWCICAERRSRPQQNSSACQASSTLFCGTARLSLSIHSFFSHYLLRFACTRLNEVSRDRQHHVPRQTRAACMVQAPPARRLQNSKHCVSHHLLVPTPDHTRSQISDLIKRLLNVRPDVLKGLHPHTEAHQVVLDADLGALVGALGV